MVKVTASEVNRLRKTTGAGMMDCKNALVEAEGDFDKAIEILRKKGQKVAAKRADRESSEGAAIAKVNDSKTEGVIDYFFYKWFRMDIVMFFQKILKRKCCNVIPITILSLM